MNLTLATLMNPVLKTDSYKLSHKAMTPEGTTKIYSYFSARFNSYLKHVAPCEDNKAVLFGVQAFLIGLKNDWDQGFFSRTKEQAMFEVQDILGSYIGMTSKDLQHFSDLYDLGYLPVEIKALPEGSVVDLQTPLITVTNTHEDYAWLTNYLETLLSSEMWKPITVATLAREMAKVRDAAWDKTVVDHTFKQFALHDFSYRGHSGTASAAVCGAAHLLYSNGTDNVPAVVLARTLYNAKNDIATSISASEHSVVCLSISLYQDESKYSSELSVLASKLKSNLEADNLGEEYKQAAGELATLYNLLVNVYPTGLFAYVADSYDYWRVLQYILPLLKDIILNRDGKIIIRPDSNDPVEMVCGIQSSVIVLDKIQDLYDIMYSADQDDTNLYTIQGYTQVFSLCGELFDNRYDYGVSQICNAFDNTLQTLVKFSYIELENVQKDTSEYKGSIQVLDELFGSTINEKGYKELDSHIGLVYGDGINYKRASTIYSELEKQGYAASNVSLGIGSFFYASSTSRDSLGMAIKASYTIVDGEAISISKDPKTDSSKKSLKGLLKVEQVDGKYITSVDVTEAEEKEGLLQTVFLNGVITNPVQFEVVQKLSNL